MKTYNFKFRGSSYQMTMKQLKRFFGLTIDGIRKLDNQGKLIVRVNRQGGEISI